MYKTERDKLTRALVKEIGEETPINKVVEGGSDWRGRAQQITLLKAKINELQQAQVKTLVHTSQTNSCAATKALKVVILSMRTTSNVITSSSKALLFEAAGPTDPVCPVDIAGAHDIVTMFSMSCRAAA